MIAKSPEYEKEVRVPAFGQKKDLYGKVKDESAEFEDFVNNVGEADDEQRGLPPMSAGERIQQKLGTGAFAPQKATPINREPLPGSPGPDQADKDRLTRMIDNESAEEDMMDEIQADETGMGQVNEFEGSAETAMDRISARVAARDGETTPMERVSERVAARTSADTVNEKSETNEAINTMLWLAGVKKKSDVSEDVPDVELTKPKFSFSPNDNKFTQLPDKGFSPAPTIEPPTQGFNGSSDAPKITQTNITKEPPRINSAAPTIEPQTKTPTVQTGVAPEITVSNSDKLPTPGKAPSDVGRYLKGAPTTGGAVGAITAIPDAYDQAKQGNYKDAAGTLGKGAIGGALTGLATDLGATALGGLGGAVLAPAAAAFLGSTSPAQGGPDVRSPLENPTPMAQQNQMQPSVGKLPSSLTFNTTPVAQQKMNDSVELHRIRSLAGLGNK
jgi:hypothetical protein